MLQDAGGFWPDGLLGVLGVFEGTHWNRRSCAAHRRSLCLFLPLSPSPGQPGPCWQHQTPLDVLHAVQEQLRCPRPGVCGFPGWEQPLEPRDTILWIYILNTHTDPPRQGGTGAFSGGGAKTLLLPTNTRSHPTRGNLLPLKFKLWQRGTDRQTGRSQTSAPRSGPRNRMPQSPWGR